MNLRQLQLCIGFDFSKKVSELYYNVQLKRNWYLGFFNISSHNDKPGATALTKSKKCFDFMNKPGRCMYFEITTAHEIHKRVYLQIQ